jgi:hypothetical protein
MGELLSSRPARSAFGKREFFEGNFCNTQQWFLNLTSNISADSRLMGEIYY